MLGGMSSIPDPTTQRLTDDQFKLKDIRDQCAFVLTQGVGIEARTLATLIIDMVDGESGDDDD